MGSQATLAYVLRQRFIKLGTTLEVVRSSKIYFTSLNCTGKLDILDFLKIYTSINILIN